LADNSNAVIGFFLVAFNICVSLYGHKSFLERAVSWWGCTFFFKVY
jgi:hypothetical protein